MNTLLTATLVVALTAVSTGPAFAQTSDMTVVPDRIELHAETTTSVGGDGEDIGASGAQSTNATSNIGSSGDDGVETTGIEHEDIGVAASGETSAMTKADLINSISTTTTSGADVFIKIGDIKGETDDSKSGNVEPEFKVEEGEAAAQKPKEIVVVGSKVRGWDPATKEAVLGVAPQQTTEVQNETDLAFLTTRLFIEHEDVPTEEISLNFEKIAWTYNEQSKLFGLITVSLPHTLEVDTRAETYGQIQVRFPWWHVFVKKPVSDIEIVALYDTEVQAWGDANIMNNAETPHLQRQAQTLQTLSNVSKALHDTAMAIIR